MHSGDKSTDTRPTILRHHSYRTQNKKALSCLTTAALLAGLPLSTLSAPMPPTFNLSELNGRNGFIARGVDFGDTSGVSVSTAGDVNDDGIDDLIIGADGGFGTYEEFPGESYVLFGRSSVVSGPILDLSTLNGSNGFVINPSDAGDRAGASVSAAGDVNGDGVSDLIIGPNTDSSNNQGQIVFGGSLVGSSGSLDLANLDGNNGFVIRRPGGSAAFGRAMAGAADINNDGVDDLIIGDPGSNFDSSTELSAGATHVVFMPLPDDTEDDAQVPTIAPGETRFLSFDPDDSVDRFTLTLDRATFLFIETANDGTAVNYDTQLELIQASDGFNITIASNDDIHPGINRYSRIINARSPGNYVIEVTSKDASTISSYALSVAALEVCDIFDPALQKTLGHGNFELLSLPCLPPVGATINDLFNDDIEGEYFDGESGTWVVFTWDPLIFDYVNPGPNGTLQPGQGFWISQRQASGPDAVPVLPEGSLNSPSTGASAAACSSDTGCLSIALSDQTFPINPNTGAPVLTLPNLIGNPYDQPLTAIDDIQVTTTKGVCSIGGGGCSPDEATLPSNGGADVLGNVAFTFNPLLRGGLGDYERVVSGNVLEPWQGFWLFQLPAGIDNNPVVRFPDLR